ncbi:hypothetical protein KSS87_023538 [Heliosperma pusillum]|nr:hypothetical protein KSS87_004723 [Heliosperma pusillum]KAH9619573.1 hypothetical protein KSS87_023538 [Heliosperma pusillum]
MGNCQAIDAASLVIQHPSGKAEKMYLPIAASEVMKMNPGHYVALLITTTICHTQTENNSPTKSNAKNNNNSTQKNCNTKGSNRPDSKNSSSTTSITARNSIRITRVKLLRPKDTLALGHVYRLISTQEVMKGLVAKKQAKMRKGGIELADSEGLKEAEILVRKAMQDKIKQVSRNGHRSRTHSSANKGTIRPKTWQPSLNSISEATS